MAIFSRRTGSHPGTSGGHLDARRVLVAAAVIVLTGLVPSVRAAATSASESDQQRVTVREERGLYNVAARFSIPHAPAAAVAVLTDYEQIPRFMPDVQTSRVLDRTADRTLVEQEAVARWMLFSRKVHLVLEVRHVPGLIRFRDVCGRSFAQYEGRWQIVGENGGASITYELTAKPSFDVPGFLLRRLLERDARRTIEQLQAEIAARANRAAGGDAAWLAR